MTEADRKIRMTEAALEELRKRSKIKRVLKWTLLGVLGLLGILVITIFLIANSQDGSIKVLQWAIYRGMKMKPNSFEPRRPARVAVREGGQLVRTNVKYGEKYPNSYLDIWYPDANDRVKRPTLIYIHGGGWFAGDKDWGDPFAGGGRETIEPYGSLAKAGFNVIVLNYAKAPEYRYPVQMIQLNDAIKCLIDRSNEYGVDMNNVVIMGGSAGAQMTAQYGLLLSDRAYATEVGIVPSIDRSSVKSLVIYSAPMRIPEFGWRMNAILWAYLGTKELDKSSMLARQPDIVSHVNSQYPPTYITDGNQPDTFPEDAKSMVRALREKSVDYQFNYYEPSEVRLGHTYTGMLDTKYGQDNLRKTIEFIRQRTGLSEADGAKESGLTNR